MTRRNERPTLMLLLTTTLLLFGNKVVDARLSSTASFRKHRGLQSICYACGAPDRMVTSLEATIDVPTQGAVSCEDIEAAGLNGLVQDELCGLMQEQASRACGCAANPDFSEAPTSSLSPTATPVVDTVSGTDPPATDPPTSAPTLVAVDTVDEADEGDEGDEGDETDQGDEADQGDAGNEGDTADQGDEGDEGDDADQGDEGDEGDAGDQESQVPSDAPSLAPSMMMMGGGDEPADPYICNVCGKEGWTITLPENMVTIPTQGLQSCEAIVAGAAAGIVPDEETCGLLTRLVAVPCGCMEEGGDMETMPPVEESEDPPSEEDPVVEDPVVDDSANALVCSSLVGFITLLVAMA